MKAYLVQIAKSFFNFITNIHVYSNEITGS